MVIRKLQIDVVDEVDFELIAIHSNLEDYRLSYFINQKLGILLSKNNAEFQYSIKEGSAHFSKFSFVDDIKDVFWDLIQNKSEVVTQKNYADKNLFENTSQEVKTNVFVLPEFKKVDFILKVQNSEYTNEFITNTINIIDRVITAYPINAQLIKSKNNLIFQ